ncbi:MAG: hypothetical protein ACPHUL_00290 [Marinomonas gallaica]
MTYSILSIVSTVLAGAAVVENGHSFFSYTFFFSIVVTYTITMGIDCLMEQN